MVVPAVVSVIVTDCAAVYVPLTGEITGVAALCGGGWLTDCSEPALPQPIPENTSAVTSSTAVTEASQRGGTGNWILERNTRANRSSAAKNAKEKPGCGRRRSEGWRGSPGNMAACEGDNVEIETVNGVATPLATVTLAGTVHCAPKGTPEHVKVIIPAKFGQAWPVNCKLQFARRKRWP